MKTKREQSNDMRMNAADFEAAMRRALSIPAPIAKDRPKMSYISSAVEVLREVGHPLSIKELLEGITLRGFWRPTGLTPRRTLQSALYDGMHHQASFPLRRVANPGKDLGKRDSVRWALKEWTDKGPA